MCIRDRRCDFCPIDQLRNNPAEKPSYLWEEYNTLTHRHYENYDSTMRWLDGRIVHFQQSVDITSAKKMSREASLDELTGMMGRRAGKERLSEVLARAKKESAAVTVCLYDVNLLKTVNDTYGHVEGDNLLTTIAKVVTGSLEKGQFEMCIRDRHRLRRTKAQKRRHPWKRAETLSLIHI